MVHWYFLFKFYFQFPPSGRSIGKRVLQRVERVEVMSYPSKTDVMKSSQKTKNRTLLYERKNMQTKKGKVFHC